MMTNSFFRLLLLAIVIPPLCGVRMDGSQAKDGRRSPQPAERSIRNRSSLSNGVYAVLSEALSSDDVRCEKKECEVLLYDRKYSDEDKGQPPKYVGLDTSFFVPLVLAGPPDAQEDGRGWTSLNITLARQHVKTLEEFTRVHLGAVIAIVIDGEIITMHKVRTVIQDGKARITRCGDDACKTLLLKLAP